MTAISARAESDERNQRAVFAALVRMTKDRTLMLECWDFFASKFRDVPVLSVSDFVGGLASHVGLDSNQKRNMTVALFAALNRDVAELPAVPARLLEAADGSANASMPSQGEAAEDMAASSSSSTPAQTVFKALLGDLCYRLARTDPDAAADLGEIVAESSLPGSVPATVFAALSAWADGGFDAAACPGDIPEQHLTDVVHQYYVAACEAVGPVAVDRLMSRAVEAASKLPEADLFPPDRLL